MTTLESLPVRFLFRFEASLSEPTPVGNGPQGDRMIFSVTGGSFAGPEIEGTLDVGPGSEWATARSDGSLKVDVRLVLRTSDGVPILMTYNGVAQVEEGGFRVRTAPMFETGDERYAWLNRVQAVGLGVLIEGGIRYDVYQIL